MKRFRDAVALRVLREALEAVDSGQALKLNISAVRQSRIKANEADEGTQC